MAHDANSVTYSLKNKEICMLYALIIFVYHGVSAHLIYKMAVEWYLSAEAWGVTGVMNVPGIVHPRRSRHLLCWVCNLETNNWWVSTLESTCVDSSWNVTADGDARERKWKGNWGMEWVASTFHTTSEHGVSSVTIADAHTSTASSQLNWCPPPI